jgi:hypothetical protein
MVLGRRVRVQLYDEDFPSFVNFVYDSSYFLSVDVDISPGTMRFGFDQTNDPGVVTFFDAGPINNVFDQTKAPQSIEGFSNYETRSDNPGIARPWPPDGHCLSHIGPL